jgi:hypothetical protein
MRSKSLNKLVLTCVLCLALIATGCSAEWINVALADLPVLTQMALNIASLVRTGSSGEAPDASEAEAIRNVSGEAIKDLVLMQQLYQSYKANPSVDNIRKIQNVITALNRNLPALFETSHIKNPALSTRVSVAVNLILTTVNTFAALIPENTVHAAKQSTGERQLAVSGPKDLKRQWNQQVCSTETDDSASSSCPLQ